MSQESQQDKKTPPAAPKKLTFGQNVLAGAIAGVSEICIMYPLDVVKTRMQLDKGKSMGTLATIRNIVASEGGLVLYRGIVSPILAEAPKRALKFASNETYKGLLADADGKLSIAKVRCMKTRVVGTQDGRRSARARLLRLPHVR